MGTSYEKLFERLSIKFKSYDLPKLSEQELKDYLKDYIPQAVVKFHICRVDLEKRNDEQECFDEELIDIEIEILSNYMLLEYLDSTYIRTPTILKATLSSSDFNAFSNANHLAKLISMHDTFLKENETLLSRYAWLNKGKGRGFKINSVGIIK